MKAQKSLTGGLFAAGWSRRLGQDKALVQFGSRSLIERAAHLLFLSKVDPLLVVCRLETRGVYQDVLGSLASSHDTRLQFIEPLGPGLSDSLRALYIAADDSPLLIHQIDRPFVPYSHLQELLRAYYSHGVSQFSLFAGQLMPPAILAPGLRDRLMELRADQGAATLVKQGRLDAGIVCFDPSQVLDSTDQYFERDVDYPEDLDFLRSLEALLF